MRRAARNLATSSSSVVRGDEEERQPRREVVDLEPGRQAARTYSMALASVNAISCTGVAPASAMW